jgi:hypothetical protein
MVKTVMTVIIVLEVAEVEALLPVYKIGENPRM